jgi:phage virion morphogenesis protein
MTGARVTIDTAALRQVNAALASLARTGRDPSPALKSLGPLLIASTRNRIVSEQTPQDTPFAALSAKTKARKRGAGILRERAIRAGLFGSLTSQVDDKRLRLGTNKVYAATHQFGRDAIPARPFLGFSKADQRQIAEVFADFVRRAGGR